MKALPNRLPEKLPPIILVPRGYRSRNGSSTWCEPEHREGLGCALEDADDVAASIRTKSEAAALREVVSRRHPWGSVRRTVLALTVDLLDVWYPVIEVEATGPSDW